MKISKLKDRNGNEILPKSAIDFITGKFQGFSKIKGDVRIGDTQIKLTDLATKDSVSNKVSASKLIWGREFKFGLSVPQHALVLIGQNTIVLCWRSGGGFNYTKICGINVNVTLEINTVKITLADNSEFTGTAFIF